jgi:hypothetical protein
MLTDCHRTPNTESQMWRQAPGRARTALGETHHRTVEICGGSAGVNPECQPNRGQTQPT